MTTSTRLVVQEIDQASLLVDNVDKWVEVKAGIIIYVAFLGNDVWSDEKTGDELLKRTVDTIWQLPTQWSSAQNKKISLKEAGADVLIVPQASLAAKLKQKTLQYHGLIEKTKGA